MINYFRNNKIRINLPKTLPCGKSWPKISIITPSYNQGNYIEETIISVLEQDYPNVEHIIIDGQSTDTTPSILNKYRNRIAHIVQEPDRGQSDAINKGMQLATGDILTWLNSDDLLAPGALAAIAMAFYSSGADVVAGVCQLFQNGQLQTSHITSCPDGPLPAEEISDLYGGWQSGKFFYQPEVMFTRTLWEKAGGYVREDLHFCMDVEMWLRFASYGAILHVIGSPIALFRIHEQQKTNNHDASPDEYIPIANSWRASRGLSLIKKKDEPLFSPPLRIAFVSDIGFQYGAGIAHRRLYEACRAAGHSTASFSTGYQLAKDEYHNKAEQIINEIKVFDPDLIICGNLHGSLGNSDMLERLTTRWPTCFCIHDLWLITGHCPHPGVINCDKYHTACDHTCPSPNSYPPISPDNIYDAWTSKKSIRMHPNLLAFANSHWTKKQYDQATPQRKAALIRLGCEEAIFKPGDKQLARKKFGLPANAFIVLMPMVNFSTPFKGSTEGLIALSQSGIPKLKILCFGVVDEEIIQQFPLLTALGYLHDPEAIANTYRAADVVVSFSHAETFGQTLMEAGCCGIPALAYGVTGLCDAVADGISGFLVQESPEAIINKLKELHADKTLRQALGTWGAIHYRNTRSLIAEYYSFFTSLTESNLLPQKRLCKSISFSKEIVPLNNDVYIGEPKYDRLKRKLQLALPLWAWTTIRAIYKTLKQCGNAITEKFQCLRKTHSKH